MDRPDRPSISCFAFCVFPMGETKDSPKRHCDHHEIPSHLQRCAARIVSRSIRRTQGIFFLSQAIHWKKAVCHKQRLQLSLPCTLHKPGIPLIFPHVFASRRTHMPCQSHTAPPSGSKKHSAYICHMATCTHTRLQGITDRVARPHDLMRKALARLQLLSR